MPHRDLFLKGLGARSIVDPTREPEVGTGKEARAGPTFDEILAGRLPAGTVALSTHAQATLQAEGIELTPMDLDRIGKGIDQLADEGGREGLLVGEKAAFVVSVPNRTITSAVARDEVRDNVFTQIDSALLID
jgi:flagellar operon protein